MTRVLVVDDHPAVRAGLVSMLRSEPGFSVVAVAEGPEDALARAHRERPDLAVVDHHLATGDGLSLSLRLKQSPHPPAVVIYSAFADRHLALAATVAGADGMVAKGVPADELFSALRTVVRGGAYMPEITPSLMETSAARVSVDDLPILGMRMDRTPLDQIAEVLDTSEQEVGARLGRMLGRLAVRA